MDRLVLIVGKFGNSQNKVIIENLPKKIQTKKCSRCSHCFARLSWLSRKSGKNTM